VSAKNVDGDTPIALAETAECVAALLDAGADPCCRRSRNSRTPLHVVAASGNEAVVSAILSHPGADLNVVEEQASCGKLGQAMWLPMEFLYVLAGL